MSEAGWTRSSDILNSKVAWAAAGSNVGRVKSESRKRQKGIEGFPSRDTRKHDIERKSR